jgi:hypothetical protein
MRVGGLAEPAPLFLKRSLGIVDSLAHRLGGIKVESTTGVETHDELIGALGQQAKELVIAEGPVADPQARTTFGQRPDLSDCPRHERVVGRFPIGGRLGGDGLLRGQILNDEHLAAENIPLEATQRFQPFHDVLEFFAVEAQRPKGAERCRQGIGHHRCGDGAQAGRRLGEETLAQTQWDAAQFPVHGLNAGLERLVFDGLLEGLVSGPTVAEDGVRDQAHEERKGNSGLIGAAAMTVENAVEEIGLRGIIEKSKNRICERQTPARFEVEVVVHWIPFPRI